MSIAIGYVLCRWLHFAALMQVFGVSCFIGFLTPSVYRARMRDTMHGILTWSAVITLLTAVMMVVLQAGMMGDGWRDSIRPAVWQAVMQTSFGQVWRYQLCFSALLLFCLPERKGRERAAFFLASALLITLAWTGHAAATPGIFGTLHRLNNSLHLLCAGYWAGGLYPFWRIVRYLRNPAGDSAAAVTALIHFSFWGHLAVAGVVLSGILNGGLLSVWEAPVWRSGYLTGLWLKMFLVCGLIAIAVYNRYWLIPRMRKAREAALRLLARNCALQVMLMLSALFTVSFFATLAPH